MNINDLLNSIYNDSFDDLVIDDTSLTALESILAEAGIDGDPDKGTSGSDTYDYTTTDTDGEKVNAGGGDDLVIGSSGDDNLSGNGNNDVILGIAGDDYLKGDGLNDVLKGGSGNDDVRGQGGDDHLVYQLSDNLNGELDTYDGGVDHDTLWMGLTHGEYDEYKNIIQDMQAFIAAYSDATTDDGASETFEFLDPDTGRTSYLTIEDFEKLEVLITNNEAAVIGATAGGVTEDVDPDSDGLLETSGKLTITDGDHLDDRFIPDTTAQTSDIHGNPTLGKFQVLNQDGDWSYEVDNNLLAIQQLAEGETITEEFLVTTIDGTTATFTITITGTNDQPDITVETGDSASDTLTETNSPLSTSGNLSVEDIDSTDVVTATVESVSQSGNGAGVITDAALLAMMSLGANPVIDGTSTTGTINWNFNSGSETFDYLGAGESLVLTYTLKATDDSGATTEPDNDTQTAVIVTITGTNDQPDITVETGDSASDTLTETNSPLSTSGNLSVEDIDITDVVNASVVSVSESGDGTGVIDNATLKAMMSLAASQVIDGTSTTGTINWNFNSGSETFDHLRAGESLVLTYTLKATDDSGATNEPDNDTQTVTITVNGTNDSPTLVSNNATSGATAAAAAPIQELEDASAQDISAITGSIQVQDLDHGDTLTASVVSSSVQLNAAALPTGVDVSPLTAASALTFDSSITSDGTNQTIGYSYDPGAVNLDFLSEGDRLTVTYTVKVNDGLEDSGTQEITFSITGTNDGPKFGGIELTSNSVVFGSFSHSGTNGPVVLNELIDTDGDGIEDEVSSIFSLGSVSGTSFSPRGIDSADIDGDGDADVAISNYSGQNLIYFNEADTDGDGADNYSLHQLSLGYSQDVEIVDLDGDGDNDLVFGGGTPRYYNGTVEYRPSHFYINEGDTDGDGKTNFTLGQFSDNDNTTTSYGIATGDFNNDGQVDVVTTNNSSDPMQIFYGQGDTTGDGLPNFIKQDLAGTSQMGVNVADFDGDGDEDMFVSRWNSLPEQIYINQGDSNGDGIVEFLTATIPGTSGNTLESAVVDLDGDGDLDVITSDYLGDIQVLYNQGDTDGDNIPDFIVDVIDTTTAISYGIAIGDADGDGDVDLVLPSNNWYGDDKSSFVENLGDTDGDGRINWSSVQLNDAPLSWDAQFMFTNTSVNTVGRIVEGDSKTTLSDSGTISFTDVDLGDGHTVTVSDQTGYLGTLTASVSDSATGDGAGQITWNFEVENADVNYLGAGDTVTQTYTLTLNDGKGGTDTQEVRVIIPGTNDVAIITGNDKFGTVQEDGISVASGQLFVSDPDQGESFFRVETITGSYGTFNITRDGTWNYSLNNPAVQFLRDGEKRTEIFKVFSQDGTDLESVAVTITGTNDIATITGNDKFGTVREDLATSDSGRLFVSDPDQAEAFFHVETINGNYGTFNITRDGTWNYSLNNPAVQFLRANQSLTERFEVFSQDGTDSEFVTVTINGTNDVATITGNDKFGTVREDLVTSDSGRLFVSDPDQGESFFRVETINGSYGTFNITRDGTWNYSLNNSSFQFLRANQSLTERFEVFSQDGTDSEFVTVTINGTNDEAVISSDSFAFNYLGYESGNVREKTFYYDSGQLKIEDLDSGEEKFKSYTQTDVYGSFTIYENGKWEYQLETSIPDIVYPNSVSQVFEVQSYDESASTEVKITISPKVFRISYYDYLRGDYRSITFDAQDPLVIDLGSEGFSFNDSVTFDLNADGTAEKTAWVNGEDGLLVMDLDGSGAIENAQEVFSEHFTPGGYASSLDALRSQDSNVDNVINSQDTNFSDILVWIDSNVDGVSDSGELFTLGSLGITSIDLGANPEESFIDGQAISARGTVTFNDGSTTEYVEVTFESINQLFGTSDADTLVGTADEDVFIGLEGDDSLTGGAGADLFVFAPASGNDIIEDFTVGEDLIILEGGLTIANITENTYNVDGVEQLGSLISFLSSDTLVLYGITGVADNLELIFHQDSTEVEIIEETFTSGNHILGTSEADTLVGTVDEDVFIGLEGDDIFNGGTGADLFVFAPGSGNDIIEGFTVGEDLILLEEDITISGITENTYNLDGVDQLGSLISFSSGDSVVLYDVSGVTDSSVLVA